MYSINGKEYSTLKEAYNVYYAYMERQISVTMYKDGEEFLHYTPEAYTK